MNLRVLIPHYPKKIKLLLVSYTVKTVHSKHAIKRTPVHSGHIFQEPAKLQLK